MTKKSKNKKHFNNRNSKNKVILFVQVFQMGAIQIEKNFRLDSFFNKKITIGCNRFCDLYLPFARNTLNLDIFKVGNGKAEILLDPRLDGYINTSQRFGDLREFTAPRDALGVLTSIDDPLVVDLKPGARGRIRIFGYDIVFKVDIPTKEIIFTKLPQIGKGFFNLPSFDSPIEKIVIPISLFAMASVFIPLIYWLLNFPNKSETGLLSIPSELSAEFIAPENIRILPFVFGDNYIPEYTSQQALLWVHELQMRWENAEQGKEYHSNIPFLAKSKPFLTQSGEVSVFQKEIINQYTTLETLRNSNTKERYYSFLKKSPIFASLLPGGEGYSNYYTIDKRIHQLKAVDKGIIEYLNLEHKILKNYYARYYGAKKIGLINPPQTGQVLGPQPDPAFNREFRNYKSAEFFANISENANFLMYLKGLLKQKSENQINNKNNDTYSESVLITTQGLMYPYQFKEQTKFKNLEEDFSAFLSNALYSTELLQIPALPKPKPSIDIKMVKFVVFNKREEIKSCYNSALRKNSSLRGEIELSWFIDEHGKVNNIRLKKSSIKNASLFQCMQSRIKSWKFPDSKNGSYLVTFPFKFTYIN